MSNFHRNLGQEIIVQVVKEGIRNKGPRLTTHFSLPARYLVLMPGDRRFGISRRLEDRSERERIKGIFNQIELPEDAGFIVRTAGEGKSDKEFIRDIKYLSNLYNAIRIAFVNEFGDMIGRPSTSEELGNITRVVDFMFDGRSYLRFELIGS